MRIHFYRHLLPDPADESFYTSVKANTLLLPPLSMYKTDFKKNGYLRVIRNKNAPESVELTRYRYLVCANTWDKDARGFNTSTGPFGKNKKPIFPAVKGEVAVDFHADGTAIRRFNMTETQSDIPLSPHGILMDFHIEYALEDSLAYHGLINSGRPIDPDTNRDRYHLARR